MWSASTWSRGRARSWSSPTAPTIPTGSPPTSSARPSTILPRRRSLITDDAAFADAVAAAVQRTLTQLASGPVAAESWQQHGTIIEVASLSEAPALANALAAEHVELAVAEPEPLLDAIRHAGSVFLGRMTPEAVGDYVAGPNHVLPTGRRARFASGLSVLDFMKRTSFIQANAAGLGAIGPAAVALAEAEGLPAHALSIALRLQS